MSDTNEKTLELTDITIVTSPQILIMYSKMLRLNEEGFIESAKANFGLTDKGADMFKEITKQLFMQSCNALNIPPDTLGEY